MSRIITDITRTKPSRRPIRPSGDPHQRFGFLQVLRGVEVGHFYVMKSEGEIVYLGRGREATFRLSHESVSRIHASVTQDSKGGFLLKDEGSTNGTIVAGRKIKRKILYPGDKFYVGDLLLRFDLMDQEDLDFQVELRQRAAAATRDALTGLLAKAYWLEEIPKLIRFSQKKNIGLGLLVIDLDHFKEINDSHGHQAGDAVLTRLVPPSSAISERTISPSGTGEKSSSSSSTTCTNKPPSTPLSAYAGNSSEVRSPSAPNACP